MVIVLGTIRPISRIEDATTRRIAKEKPRDDQQNYEFCKVDVMKT